MPEKILTCVFEDADAGAELAERHPVQRGLGFPRGRVGQFGKRLFLDRDDGHLVALGAGGIEHEKRKTAVASDET
jgi:hypothetical protein